MSESKKRWKQKIELHLSHTFYNMKNQQQQQQINLNDILNCQLLQKKKNYIVTKKLNK